MAEARTTPRISPFCGDLLSKKSYFLTAPPTTEEDTLDGSGRVWCERTMQSVGPDGELVDPDACRRGRACFRGFGPQA